MVSGRGEHGLSNARRVPSSVRLTAYDRERKPHQLRSGVDTRSVRIEWIASELACGLCSKVIQNAMVTRSCMHRFCADCILPKIHTGAKKCPLCKKVLPKKSPLKSDANFDAIISKFSMTPERRCIKRPISESSNLCFAKKRKLFHKRSPVKATNQPDTKSVHCPSNRLPSFKNWPRQFSAKPDSSSESAFSCGDVKPQLVSDSRSETSEPSLVIDESCSSDSALNFGQPTTSSTPIERCSPLVASPSSASTKGVSQQEGTIVASKGNASVMLQRGSLMNFASQSASLVVLSPGVNISRASSKRFTPTGNSDTSPIILLQNSCNSEHLNGSATESTKITQNHHQPVSRSGLANDSSSKYVPIQPHPRPFASNQMNGPSENSAAPIRTAVAVTGVPPPPVSAPANQLQEANSSVKTAVPSTSTNSVKAAVNGNGTFLVAQDEARKSNAPSSSGVNGIDSIAPPPDYFFLPQKQRLSSGFDAELILYPDASVFRDKKLPDFFRRPRFVLTYPLATVGHLCEYLMQRLAVESGCSRLKKKRILLSAVKADLHMDDVLVVSETGEGQFATINVNCDPSITSVFTIAAPFNALDDQITVERLRTDHWANKKRPLRLIFKVAALSQLK